MANQSINISKTGNPMLVGVELHISVSVAKGREIGLRDIFNQFCDKVSSEYEVNDTFDLGKEPRKALPASQPEPINKIIDKKKQSAKKLSPAPKKAETVKKAEA